MNRPDTPPENDECQRRHHRLSLVFVNDVYSFDDLDSSSTTPRGGWSRAATLMKQLSRGVDGRTGTTDVNVDDTTKSATTSASSISRDSETTVLTVANGDVLGGSSLLQHCEGSVAIEVMNSIPINLAVLGNHEFDYGDEVLMQRVKESNFAWLGSNVYYPTQSGTDSSNLSKICTKQNGQITEKHPIPAGHTYFPGIHGNGKIYNLSNNLKLGVFGLVTKLTPKISYPSPKVVFDGNIISVARRTARLLREQGAQIIVAITHMSEAEDLLLASDRVAAVDLILGGHEHEPLSAMVHRGEHDEEETLDKPADSIAEEEEEERHNEGGVLVFKCGMNAYWVGEVHLELEYECRNNSTNGSIPTTTSSDRNSKRTSVTSIVTSWSMQAVTHRTGEDAEVSSIVKKFRKQTDEQIMVSSFGEEIASKLSLDDVVACIEGSVDGNTNTKILPLDTRMSSVRRREATGGNMLADSMHWLLQTNIQTCQHSSTSSTLPMLAMINGGFIRGDRLYKPGASITVRHVVKELPFPKCMAVLEIDGNHLKMALAQQLKGCSRGPTGSFPHLSSNVRLKYEILPDAETDPTKDVIEVHSFTIDGLEVSDDQKYIIAVTEFIAGGNEGCLSWLESTRIDNPAWADTKISCVLLKYLQHHRLVSPVIEGRVEMHT